MSASSVCSGEVCENFLMGRCSEGVDCKYAHPETSMSLLLVLLGLC